MWHVGVRPFNKTELDQRQFRSSRFEHDLAKQAYKSPQERSQYFATQEGVELLNEFNLDEFYSVKYQGKIYNVHRGSTTRKDWTESDVQLAAGELNSSDRYLRSKELSREVMDRYNLPTVEVGHSLGGTIAEKIALDHGTESTVFNMGTTPLEDYRSIDRSKHRHFRMDGDRISGFDPTATTLQRPSGTTPFGVQLLQLSLPLFLPAAGKVADPLVGTATQHPLNAFDSLL